MDIARILAELKKHRRALDQAIAALEGFAPNSQKSARSNRRPSNVGKSRQKSSVASASRPSARACDTVAKVIPFRRTRRRATPQRQAEQA